MSALEEFDAYVTACNEAGQPYTEDSNQFIALALAVADELREALTSH